MSQHTWEATITSLLLSVFPFYSQEPTGAFWGLFLSLLQAVEKGPDLGELMAPHPVLRP